MAMEITALGADRRGGSLVPTLLLGGALVLGAVVAVRGFGLQLGGKANCAGAAIVNLESAAAPCSDGDSVSSLPPVALSAAPPPAAVQSASSSSVSLVAAASPTASPAPGASEETGFAPQSEQAVKAVVTGALARSGGDVERAFADLRAERQEPARASDANLALALEYLGARVDVRRNGPAAARDQLEAQLAQATGAGQEAAAPASPLAELQAKFMRLGIEDEEAELGLLQDLFSVSPTGVLFGEAQAGLEAIQVKK